MHHITIFLSHSAKAAERGVVGVQHGLIQIENIRHVLADGQARHVASRVKRDHVLTRPLIVGAVFTIERDHARERHSQRQRRRYRCFARQRRNLRGNAETGRRGVLFGGGVGVQIDVLSAIKKAIQDTGVAALYITHDLATVKAIADQIAVMHRGKVVRYGPKSQVPAPPFDDYTNLLLASVPEMKVGWLENVVASRKIESAGS
jgi:hypothetical protein